MKTLHLLVKKMDVPLMENPETAYLYHAEQLDDYTPNPKGKRKGTLSKKQAINLVKMHKAQGHKVSAKLLKKAGYKANSGRKPKKRKTTKKRKYKKNYGTKAGAKKAVTTRKRRYGVAGRRRYTKNPKRRYTKNKPKVTYRYRYRKNPKKRAVRKYKKYKKNPGLNFKKDVGILRPAGIKAWKQKPMQHIGISLLGVIDTSLIGWGIELGLGKIKQLDGGVKRDVVRIISKLFVGTLVSYGIAKMTKNTKYGKLHQTGVYISVGLDIIGTLIKHYTGKKIEMLVPGMKGSNLGFMPIPRETFFEVFGFGQIRRGYLLGKVSKAIQSGNQLAVVQTQGYSGIRNMTTGEMLIKGTHDGISNFAGGILFETDGNRFGETISVEEGGYATR